MFLSCGDALFDLFASEKSTDSVGAISLAGAVCGSPMNVALGLARLGHHSRYITRLSSDLFGERIREYLAENNVDTSLSIDTDLHTTLAIVQKQSDGSADYAFYINNTADVSMTNEDIPQSLPDDLRVLHFGSYSTAVDPTASTLMSLAKRQSASHVISYDPNLRPSIEPDTARWQEVFNVFGRTANLIKASDEDIETLLGKNSEERFVADCFSMGAQLVFITRGPNGASGFKPDGSSVHVPGASVSVVDTVGAGDTFQTTLLHWLAAEGHITEAADIQGEVDLDASMKLAIRAAGITCTRRGADLPTLADLS